MIDFGKMFVLSWKGIINHWQEMGKILLLLQILPSVIGLILLMPFLVMSQTIIEPTWVDIQPHVVPFCIALIIAIAGALFLFPAFIVILQSKKKLTLAEILSGASKKLWYHISSSLLIIMIIVAVMLVAAIIIILGGLLLSLLPKILAIILGVLGGIALFLASMFVIFYYGVKITFTSTVAVAENKNGWLAMIDSYKLSNGQWLSMFLGLVIVVFVQSVILAPSWMLNIVVDIMNAFSKVSITMLVLQSIFTLILNTISILVVTTLTYYLYVLVKEAKFK